MERKIDGLLAELVELNRRAWYPRLAAELMASVPFNLEPMWFWDLDLDDDEDDEW